LARKIDIDTLIQIVSRGGKMTTGIDVYNGKGTLLLDRNFLVTSTKILEKIKENGIKNISLSSDGKSGIWDSKGGLVSSKSEESISKAGKVASSFPGRASTCIEKRLFEIEESRKLAQENYEVAKKCIKQALADIKSTGGEFDYQSVSAHIFRLTEFLSVMDNPFSYLTREIFSHDDYLYNHAINVCTIGTAIMNKFNTIFSAMINGHLNAKEEDIYNPFGKQSSVGKARYRHFQKDELQNISLGFFLHDIGKVLVSDEILNKSGKLTLQEFDTIKKHSYDFGLSILEKNKLNNPIITSIVQYHHAPLYKDEKRCYPEDKSPDEIQVYTKVCKLADIYDAMTSKRSYKEASNQINVVTQIFRSYAKKDAILQYVLHAFIKSIGIYPPGSIVFLRNGQMGYVLESQGPFIIPFTDTRGARLSGKPAPLDLSDSNLDVELKIDSRRSVKNPLEVYELLPPYLKPMHPEAESATARLN